MTFSFEPPPPGAEPERPPMPPWMQPPDDELGVSLPLRFVLARTPSIVIAVTNVGVYSTGFELTMRVRARDGEVPGGLSAIRPGLGSGLRPGASLPDDLFRFGLQYSDGRKGTSVDWPRGHMQQWADAVREGKQPELPAGPVVMQRGGGGGGRGFDWQWWIWPLPPPGPVTLAAEWPGAGITLTTREVDAGLLLDAAANVERFWPPDAES